MDRPAPAAENVVEFPTPDAPEPSELDLAKRLVELLEAKGRSAQAREATAKRLDELEEGEAKIDQEVTSIKRALGQSVKRGRRGSHPTRAAGSNGSSPTQQVLKAMEDGQERNAGELCELLGATSVDEKAPIRNALARLAAKGTLTRRKCGRLNTGRARYAYRLKKSRR